MSYKPYRRTDKQIMQRSNPQYRVHTSLGAVIQGKPTIARSIILDVCTDEGTLEEPRATCMEAEMVRYIQRQADTRNYLHPAPVTDQSRCIKTCDAERPPIEATPIITATMNRCKIPQNASPQILSCRSNTTITATTATTRLPQVDCNDYNRHTRQQPGR